MVVTENEVNNLDNRNGIDSTKPHVNGMTEEGKQQYDEAVHRAAVEEQIRENDVFKNMQHNLKEYGADVSVDIERIVDTYFSFTSSAGSLSNGQYLVDETIIQMALARTCYEISIEENGVVLDVNGDFIAKDYNEIMNMSVENVTFVKYLEVSEPSKQWLEKMIEEKPALLLMETGCGSQLSFDQFRRAISNMSKEEKRKYFQSEKGNQDLNEQFQKEEVYSFVDRVRLDANIVEVKDVMYMGYIGEIQYWRQQFTKSTNDSDREAFSNMIEINLQKIKDLRTQEGPSEYEQQIFNGEEINYSAANKLYSEHCRTYGMKEDVQRLQELQKLSTQREYRKLRRPSSQLTAELIDMKKEMLERAWALYRTGDKEAIEIAMLTFDSFGFVKDRTNEIDQKALLEECKQLSKLSQRGKQTGRAIVTIEDLDASVMDRHRIDTREHDQYELKKGEFGTLKRRPKEDAIQFGEEKKLRRISERTKSKSEKEANNSSKERKKGFSAIKLSIGRMLVDGKNDTIDKRLDALLGKVDLTKEDFLVSAMLSKVYTYNALQKFKAGKEGNKEEFEQYNKNMKYITRYVGLRDGKYRDLFDETGDLDIRHGNERVKIAMEALNDQMESLAEQGITMEAITEIFTSENSKSRQLANITKGGMKEAKEAIKVGFEAFKRTRIGGLLRSAKHKLLSPPKDKSEEAIPKQYEKLLEDDVLTIDQIRDIVTQTKEAKAIRDAHIGKQENLSQEKVDAILRAAREGDNIVKQEYEREQAATAVQQHHAPKKPEPKLTDQELAEALVGRGKYRGQPVEVRTQESMERVFASVPPIDSELHSDVGHNKDKKGLFRRSKDALELGKTIGPGVRNDSEKSTFDDSLKVDQSQLPHKITAGELKKLAFELCQSQNLESGKTVAITQKPLKELASIVSTYTGKNYIIEDDEKDIGSQGQNGGKANEDKSQEEIGG